MRCTSVSRALVAQRHLKPLCAHRLDDEVDRTRPHGGNHVVDAAVRRLHDHRHVQACLAHFREHAKAVEVGHHEIEHDRVDPRAVAGEHKLEGGVATFHGNGVVAETARHAFDQPALHRVVVDDENGLGHHVPLLEHDLFRKPVPTFRDHALKLCRFGPLSPGTLKGVLPQAFDSG
jgi:hypothetical protein